jgi:hypothetical protein
MRGEEDWAVAPADELLRTRARTGITARGDPRGEDVGTTADWIVSLAIVLPCEIKHYSLQQHYITSSTTGHFSFFFVTNFQKN